MDEVVLALGAGVLALLFAGYLTTTVLKHDQGNEAVREITSAIQEGAMAFLTKEYRYLAVFVIIVTAILGIFIDYRTAIAYAVGALCSAGTGFIGMNIAVRANGRTATAALDGLNPALRIAFSSGAVMGITVVGVGILGLGTLYYIFGIPDVLAGFGFGASSIALFARVGGGIFTKAADVGTDLVGKVEAGIPEDDPRNPGVIADNVGDNVGDVAGMGADLFESYVGSIIATMALSALAYGTNGVILPFLIAGVGIIACIIGTFFVRVGDDADPGRLLWALRQGIFVAAGLVAAASFGVVSYLGMDYGVFYAIIVGLAAGILIGLSTEYYTSAAYGPTKTVAESAETGTGTLIISGLASGMMSTLIPLIIVAVAILASYSFAGIYGIAISAVGMLSTLGITLATDAYGPVADNAGGIAEQAHLPPEVRERTDALDSLGNTTAATGKGFAIGSAVLTALALMAAYANAVNITTISLLDPPVLVGLLIGTVLPFVFSALTMNAVGTAAYGIVTEVRRQFREIPGLMEGTAKPDYARCVAISTESALREMILPGLMSVIVPVATGFILGPTALGGLLIGATATGFLLAVMMANAGGSWDNAKKYIESGALGGKGSEPHKAAVVGDTVGDPFKDTSGPSLNILIKLMSIVSLVFAPIFPLIPWLVF